MKLDPTYLTFITKEEMRVLLAVEMGMRNHEFVPTHLIEKISRLNRSCAYTYLKLLNKHKLVYHQRKCYDGYKLTYLGYDYLALHVLMKRGEVKEVIGKIGVGKESDIYKCTNEHGEVVVLKLARLGRVSFKTVKNNRDYIKHRTQYNWLYLSRLQAIKEYSFMELLHKNGFPTPTPKSQNRHAIVMSLADGLPMTQIKKIGDPSRVHNELIDLIRKLAEHGLIHSDFNEFNLLLSEQYKITMIDFPQMVSTKHLNAQMYFERDVNCIHRYFFKKMKFESNYTINFDEIEKVKDLDIEIQASGFIKKELKNAAELDILDDLVRENDLENEDSDDYGHEEDEDEEENSENEEEDEEDEEEEDNEEQEEDDDEEEEIVENKKEKQEIDNYFEEIKQNEDFNLDNDDFDLNEEFENQEEFIDADINWNLNSDNEDEEQENKKSKKQQRKDKKNKNKKDPKQLREQLLQKIKLKEEQQKLQQQKQEKQQENNKEQQQENSENEQEEEEDNEQMAQINKENEALKLAVESNIKSQVNKQFKTKFKIQKFNKRPAKDVKNNVDFF